MTLVEEQELIKVPGDISHVVILGAGASRAAFPHGDANGRKLPVMADLIELLELEELLRAAGVGSASTLDFEVVYAELTDKPQHGDVVVEIERRVRTYFSQLQLPQQATLYDRILLALRPIDSIFTFNWDPFLLDAYMRNRGVVALPSLFFLHGNVRIFACPQHGRWGLASARCPDCGRLFVPVPLLYPVHHKDYSKDTYVRQSWKCAKSLLKYAFTFTVFGYGCPKSDKDAVDMLKGAWLSRSNRELEHIQIIDTADTSTLEENWAEFAPTLHYDIQADFYQSRLHRWPRRSCESLYAPMSSGKACMDFPLPASNCLLDLQQYACEIARFENNG